MDNSRVMEKTKIDAWAESVVGSACYCWHSNFASKIFPFLYVLQIIQTISEWYYFNIIINIKFKDW